MSEPFDAADSFSMDKKKPASGSEDEDEPL
jgi:hypothetical protein